MAMRGGEECPDALPEEDLAVGGGGGEQRLQALLLLFADDAVGCDGGGKRGRSHDEEKGEGVDDNEQP